MSCPPTTRSFQSSRSSDLNCGRALTSPASLISPFFKATRPVMAVVATPPLAPINQSPIRGMGEA